jgi:hypothetical protein
MSAAKAARLAGGASSATAAAQLKPRKLYTLPMLRCMRRGGEWLAGGA